MSGFSYVTPAYFAALQIPLLAGRAFTDADRRGTQLVAIVNRTFARRFFGSINPVGQPLDGQGTIIVGVVEDVTVAPHSEAVNDPLGSEPMTYVPAAQAPIRMLAVVHGWFQPSWIVRTSGPIEGLTGQMQRALASTDPGLPFSGFYGMADHMEESLATQRVEVALLVAMAGLALLLSAVGIFTLVANIVSQRTREIGIRIALGSTLSQAIARVATPGLRSSAVGLVLGLVLCFEVLRILRSALYGVGVYDAPTLLSVAAVLGMVTILATTIPALRIAKTDPATTLREQ